MKYVTILCSSDLQEKHFENVFSIKTGVSQSVSPVDPTPTTSSILDYVERMAHVEGEPDGVISRPDHSVEITEPRRSKRSRISKDLRSDFITFNMEDDLVTFKQTMASPKAKLWKESVNSEIQSIVSNGIWELVDVPPRCLTVGCKWIFKKKLNPDGTINKYKARLVAKGFTQR